VTGCLVMGHFVMGRFVCVLYNSAFGKLLKMMMKFYQLMLEISSGLPISGISTLTACKLPVE
jgi:hypothetical protein